MSYFMVGLCTPTVSDVTEDVDVYDLIYFYGPGKCIATSVYHLLMKDDVRLCGRIYSLVGEGVLFATNSTSCHRFTKYHWSVIR